MDKQPLIGQFKFTENGSIIVVAPAASDKPVKESQASLLEWAEDKAKLELWTAPDQPLDNNP